MTQTTFLPKKLAAGLLHDHSIDQFHGRHNVLKKAHYNLELFTYDNDKSNG
jgi:hypothetical protein